MSEASLLGDQFSCVWSDAWKVTIIGENRSWWSASPIRKQKVNSKPNKCLCHNFKDRLYRWSLGTSLLSRETQPPKWRWLEKEVASWKGQMGKPIHSIAIWRFVHWIKTLQCQPATLKKQAQTNLPTICHSSWHESLIALEKVVHTLTMLYPPSFDKKHLPLWTNGEKTRCLPSHFAASPLPLNTHLRQSPNQKSEKFFPTMITSQKNKIPCTSLKRTNLVYASLLRHRTQPHVTESAKNSHRVSIELCFEMRVWMRQWRRAKSMIS